MLSIRALLTALFVVPLVIATGLVAFVSQKIARHAVEEYAVSVLQSDAEAKRDSIMAVLKRQRTAAANYLANAEANCGISGRLNSVCAREVLEEFAAHEHAQCAVLQTRRVTLAAHGCQLLQTGTENQGLSFAVSGSSYVVAAQNRDFASQVRAEYSTEEMDRILSGGEFGVISSTLLLTGTGRVLSAPGASHLATANCSSTHAQDGNGRRFLVRSVGLPLLGGCVISRIPERQALSPSSVIRSTSWLMIAGFVVAGLLLSYGAATLMSAPLERLTRSATHLPDGDFDSDVLTSGPAEIRELGLALSEAAVGLKSARQTELERERTEAESGMAAALAHQINNPLTSVISALSLLGDRVLDAEGQKLLRFASQDAQRIATITRQLITLHRGSTSPRVLQISELLANIIEQQRSELDRRGITVRQELSPISVGGYERELRQALSNVLRNAVAAASSGSAIVVRCGMSRDWRPPFPQGARITIHDLGPGVEPSLKAKLMQPFVSSSTVRGRGLGLWVANAAVQKHHGRLRVRSGAGFTSVSIFLPQGTSAAA